LKGAAVVACAPGLPLSCPTPWPYVAPHTTIVAGQPQVLNCKAHWLGWGGGVVGRAAPGPLLWCHQGHLQAGGAPALAALQPGGPLAGLQPSSATASLQTCATTRLVAALRDFFILTDIYATRE